MTFGEGNVVNVRKTASWPVQYVAEESSGLNCQLADGDAYCLLGEMPWRHPFMHDI